MAYSSIIELIGIRELAEDDPKAFIEAINSFKGQINIAFNAVLTDSNELYSFQAHLFRDYCYIQCNNIDKLLKFLEELRYNLLVEKSFMFRAAIIKGILNLDKNDEDIQIEDEYIKGVVFTYGFGVESSKLYGIIERFKGAGIFIDEDLKNELNEFLVFQNYYITDISTRKYHQYWDVRFNSKDQVFNKLNNVIKKVYESRVISKKLARFYVPFLVNLARNLEYNIEDKNYTKILDDFIKLTVLEKLKDIVGIELVYLTLIERIFSDDDKKSLNKNNNPEVEKKIEDLIIKLSKNNWLLEILRADNKFHSIPQEIINSKTRRKALREFAVKSTVS
ncbi:hypothetical protein [Spirosoma fluviale]|uniref:Uncharacterized protein n=1 Tax=Spirosoma fluviale TaxID=1597977 RepID=A0A286GXF3_9BACT|nr:hypothetical protein [Spirosoma fluviale]SOD99759.1 hypothetical protein SAMN06269250_0149 [Spirosoma fluviale]